MGKNAELEERIPGVERISTMPSIVSLALNTLALYRMLADMVFM